MSLMTHMVMNPHRLVVQDAAGKMYTLIEKVEQVDWAWIFGGFVTMAVVIAVIYYFNHRDGTYKQENPKSKGEGYSRASNYVNVSPMKHDLFKQATVELMRMMLIIFFISRKNHMGEYLVKMMYGIIGFIIYYQVIEPLINYIRDF